MTVLDINMASKRWKISIAPMLDWTDRHYRYLVRLLTKHTRLYTEMVHACALIYGAQQERLLQHRLVEHPLALQLAGNEPSQLAQACLVAKNYGFAEINLNAGCPSERVQKGAFGAILMRNTMHLAACLNAMQQAVDMPITLKHRIGLDQEQSYEWLRDFVGEIAHRTTCRVFIVHARNAWLKGLSPKENRQIPPLKYDYVYRLKQDFSNLTIVLNGGITSHESMKRHLQQVDGVMIGREAYHRPMFVRDWDTLFFADKKNDFSLEKLIERFFTYAKQELALYPEMKLRDIVKPSLGLFANQRGGKVWRQYLSNPERLKNNDPQLILDAFLAVKKKSVLDESNNLCGNFAD